MVREEMKKYIEEIGIKQNVLATRAGMTPQALSTFLNGNRGMDIEEYIRLCDVMNVSYDRFMSRTA